MTPGEGIAFCLGVITGVLGFFGFLLYNARDKKFTVSKEKK